MLREVREELGAAVEDLELLAAVENLLHINEVLGHEIVFLYLGRLSHVPAEAGATPYRV